MLMLVAVSSCNIEMYNQNSSEHHKGHAPPMSPRISFSHDFVESSSHSHHHNQIRKYRDAPVSSDFEFSVSNHSMISADELFFKGKLLPFKENCRKPTTTTLRDELQNEDDCGEFSARPPKNPARWRGFLGLKKSQSGLRKSDKGQSSRSSFHLDDVQSSKNSQESE